MDISSHKHNTAWLGPGTVPKCPRCDGPKQSDLLGAVGPVGPLVTNVVKVAAAELDGTGGRLIKAECVIECSGNEHAGVDDATNSGSDA